ncbi:GGDEF domain-containing protein [Rubrivivax sp. RP6-9]|uniref:GGDEF domain-containing protein n=1 Tax=Rubrivivax sp. RP6-9 TaxID=3415750 RepID=UPI003CC5BCDC
MHALLDALLTRDPLQRARLSQALWAMLLMSAGIVAMHYFVWIGAAPARGVAAWTLLAVGGMAGAYALIRSGWSRRLADPSMTVLQMGYAVTCGAWAYALVGAGRGGVFPVVMVILMFGMFIATPRQMVGVSLYAVSVFGATMALMAWLQPQVYAPAIELGHFLMVATMMPAVSILAARLARMRQRARTQRAELTAALARIRELATRDELTGLINRRHLQELMEQEHQRCIRSGHTFCIAVLEIDDFDRQAAGLGDHGRDELLHGVAVEGQRYVRVADVLAYWGGQRMVLLMSDTRAPLARAGLDRLRERVAASRVVPRAEGLRVTLSAGLAEHHAGETVVQTLARAEACLAEGAVERGAGASSAPAVAA